MPLTIGIPLTEADANWLRAYLAVQLVKVRQEIEYAERDIARDPGRIRSFDSTSRLGMLRHDLEHGSAVLEGILRAFPAPARGLPRSTVVS